MPTRTTDASRASTHLSDDERCCALITRYKVSRVYVCPGCGGRDAWWIAKWRRWECKSCGRQTSVWDGTRFRHTRLSPSRWAKMIWAAANDPRGSSPTYLRQIGGCSYPTALRALLMIGDALRPEGTEKLRGRVLLGEARLGKRRVLLAQQPRGGYSLGRLRSEIIRDTRSAAIQRFVRRAVEHEGEVRIVGGELDRGRGSSVTAMWATSRNDGDDRRWRSKRSLLQNWWRSVHRGRQDNMTLYLAVAAFRMGHSEAGPQGRFVRVLQRVLK